MSFSTKTVQIILAFNFILKNVSPYPSFTVAQDYNFEKHIPIEKLDPADCNIIIISEDKVDFQPIHTYPFMFISSKTANLTLFKVHCIILILPEFKGLTKSVKHMLRAKEDYIKLVLIYPKSNEFASVKKVRNFIRTEIIMINKTTDESKTYEAYNTRCKGNVKCILNRRVLRMGYTSNTYLKAKNWDHYKSKSQPIPNIVLNLTNPVHDHFDGFESEFMEMLVQRYGMTLVMIAPPDFAYGGKLNGTWTGKLGLLSRNEVDCVVPAVSANEERTELGDYSNTMYMTRFTLTSKKTVHAHENWNSVLLSFDLPLWILIFTSILVVCPSVWMVTKIHHKIVGVKVPQEESILRISGSTYRTLVAAPMTHAPNGPATLIVGSWIICCLILHCAYISSFMSKLSVPDRELTLDTIDDAWRQKSRLIINPGYTTELFFEKSRDQRAKDLYSWRTTSGNHTLSDEEFFNFLDNGFVFCNSDWNVKKRIYGNGKSHIYHVSPKPFLTLFSAWIFAEDDSFIKTAVNSLILRAAAHGFLQKWEAEAGERLYKGHEGHRHGFNKSDDVTKFDKVSTASLALYHLQGVFLFWIVGALVSALVVLFEKISFKRKPVEMNSIIFPYLR